MDELVKSLLQIGGPTAIVAAVGIYMYLRVDGQRQKAQDTVNEMLRQQIEGDFKVAASTEGAARSVDALRAMVEALRAQIDSLRADVARIRP